MRKTIQISTASILFTLCFAFLFSVQAKAEYVEDNANGVSYYDSKRISSGYAYEYAKGAGGYSYIRLDNTGDRVTNVKSSSKNLIAKKTCERVYTNTDRDYNYNTNQYEVTKSEISYSSTYISFFGKKKGTYKVTFDVIKSDGTLRCSKTVTVKVDSNYSSNSAIKKITYAGKNLYNYYPFTTKTSGKLKVTMKKGYKFLYFQIGKRNSSGEWKYTKLKNNKTLKLAKSSKYKYTYGDSIDEYNELFPTTQIKVYYKNNKTKAIEFEYCSDISTINKK